MLYTMEFEPAGIRLVCDEPLTIAEAALRAGVGLRADCGRRAICGKCRVRIESSTLPRPSSAERTHLNDEELADGWRLACQALMAADCKVYVPPTVASGGQVVQVEGRVAKFAADPTVRTQSLEVAAPTLHDQTADLDRVAQALAAQHGLQGGEVGLPALCDLRQALREGEWRVWLALSGSEIVAASAQPFTPAVGLAVDVGTTKLACYLVDLETGRTLATRGVMNPQIAYGEDVMSRLEAAMGKPEAGARQQQAVVEAINEVAAALCAVHNLAPERILDACLVGNTAMHHLLLGLPVEPLGVSPFVSATGLPLCTVARSIALRAAPGAYAYLPPPIAAFVGSDHLAFLLASGFGQDNRTRLGLDIGTNTEIALQAGGRIVSCSTASGPAFEGAHIRHGMRAAAGAIEHVRIDDGGAVCCRVIGDVPATGICGSGVLDALAEMYRTGRLNRRGRIQRDAAGVRCEAEGMLAFLLAPGTNGRRDVVITQKDIEQILLAKGAIHAGIDILMAHLGVVPDDLDEVVIAGAFGSYLDPGNAVRIGLLPRVAPERIRVVGNAAGAGACMMLASQGLRRRAEQLARCVEYVELTVCPSFTRAFVEGTRMPDRG